MSVDRNKTEMGCSKESVWLYASYSMMVKVNLKVRKCLWSIQ